MTASDGSKLGEIISSSPSTGVVGFTYDYQRDVFEVNDMFSTDLKGVVAEIEGSLIGMILGDVMDVQWNGHVRQAIYISNLRVHPHFRRQGVARGLIAYGFEYMKHLFERVPLIYAAIPAGNITEALTSPYDLKFTPSILGGIVPMRRSPPSRRPDLVVRLASEADLTAIADGMNRFYAGSNLWSPVSTASLRGFVETKFGDLHPNHLYVVKRNKQIVGGLSLSNRTELVRMMVTATPWYIRMLGALLGILPKDGILRALTIRRVWFMEGELDAGRYLWQYLRYQRNDIGNSMGIAFDPRSQLKTLFQIPFWLPLFAARYAVSAPQPMDLEREIYCLAGP
jgi:hypothetical protein